LVELLDRRDSEQAIFRFNAIGRIARSSLFIHLDATVVEETGVSGGAREPGGGACRHE
jgi:hypothetical protein